MVKGITYKQLFWITGILAFFISPIADNLTTALIMCAVDMVVGKDKPKFVGLSCINIVVGANADGNFSSFGDITTLIVWQKGMVNSLNFLSYSSILLLTMLFLPLLFNLLFLKENYLSVKVQQ
jgi:Na+/H+ antiporter NhaD/arsenite permease-like protein